MPKYDVRGKSPDLVADFVEGYYRQGGADSNFPSTLTHSRAGLATMVDSDGKLKWAPHNAISYSEDFQAVFTSTWNKVRCSVEAGHEAPDGADTAFKLVEDTATGTHQVLRSTGATCPTGAAYTVGVFLKAGERDEVVVKNYSSSSFGYRFGLTSGTLEAVYGSTPTSQSITSVGNGWYYCTVTANVDATTVNISIQLRASADSYAGDGSSGAYIWGAHIFRSDLGGMVDAPADHRGLSTVGSYVRTAPRALSDAVNIAPNGTFNEYGSDVLTNGDWTGGDTGGLPTGWVKYDASTPDTCTLSVTDNVLRIDGGHLDGLYQTGAATVSKPSRRKVKFKKISGASNATLEVYGGAYVKIPHGENIVERSHEFDNGWWTPASATVTANQATAPDDTTTADLIVPDDTAVTAYLVRGSCIGHTGTYTVSVYVKPAGLTSIKMVLHSLTSTEVVFNLTGDGSISSGTGGAITAAANGFYRCSVTKTITDLTNNQIQIVRNTATGNGTDGWYVWGAQLEEGATATTLIPTAGAPGPVTDWTEYEWDEGRTTDAMVVMNIGGADSVWDIDYLSVTELDDWEVDNAAFEITGGEVVCAGAATPGGSLLAAGSHLENGAAYVVSLDISDCTAGGDFELKLGSIGTDITYTFDTGFSGTITGGGTSNGTDLSFYNGSAAFTFDNLVIKKADSDPSVDSYQARRGHHNYSGSAYVDQGCLIESPAATNLCDMSNSGWDTAPWYLNQVTLTENDATSPAGTTTAHKIAGNGTSNSIFLYRNQSAAAGGQHTLSVYAKAGTAEWLFFTISNWTSGGLGESWFDLENGVIGSTVDADHTARIEDCGNDWYRCSISFDVDAGDLSGQFKIRLSEGDGLSNINTNLDYCWVYGVQFEAGYVATSYIPTPTVSTTVTRAAETLVVPAGIPEISATANSMQMNGTLRYEDEDSAGQMKLLEWDAGGSEGYFRWSFNTDDGTGQINFVQKDKDAVTDTVETTGSVLAPGSYIDFNVAARHLNDEINGASAGTALTANTSVLELPIDLDAVPLEIGHTDFIGTIKQFRMWDQDLTDVGITAASQEPTIAPSPIQDAGAMITHFGTRDIIKDPIIKITGT